MRVGKKEFTGVIHADKLAIKSIFFWKNKIDRLEFHKLIKKFPGVVEIEKKT